MIKLLKNSRSSSVDETAIGAKKKRQVLQATIIVEELERALSGVAFGEQRRRKMRQEGVGEDDSDLESLEANFLD